MVKSLTLNSWTDWSRHLHSNFRDVRGCRGKAFLRAHWCRQNFSNFSVRSPLPLVIDIYASPKLTIRQKKQQKNNLFAIVLISNTMRLSYSRSLCEPPFMPPRGKTPYFYYQECGRCLALSPLQAQSCSNHCTWKGECIAVSRSWHVDDDFGPFSATTSLNLLRAWIYKNSLARYGRKSKMSMCKSERGVCFRKGLILNVVGCLLCSKQNCKKAQLRIVHDLLRLLFTPFLLHRNCNCLDSFIFAKYSSYLLGRLWGRRSRNKLCP